MNLQCKYTLAHCFTRKKCSFLKKYFMCISMCLYEFICTMYVQVSREGHWIPYRQIQMVRNHHAGTENQMQVLGKSIKCSQPSSHLSSLKFDHFYFQIGNEINTIIIYGLKSVLFFMARNIAQMETKYWQCTLIFNMMANVYFELPIIKSGRNY